MVKTPTYHVFDMYKYHQDAQLLESSLRTDMTGPDEWRVPELTESVSVDNSGVIHITMTNLSAENAVNVSVVMEQGNCRPGKIRGEILAGEMHAKNTFEDPECVRITQFHSVTPAENGFAFTIPACSVVHLAVDPE